MNALACCQSIQPSAQARSLLGPVLQHGMRPLHEELSQVFVSTSAGFGQILLASCRVLAGHHSQPGSKSSAFLEGCSIADRRDRATGTSFHGSSLRLLLGRPRCHAIGSQQGEILSVGNRRDHHLEGSVELEILRFISCLRDEDGPCSHLVGCDARSPKRETGRSGQMKLSTAHTSLCPVFAHGDLAGTPPRVRGPRKFTIGADNSAGIAAGRILNSPNGRTALMGC